MLAFNANEHLASVNRDPDIIGDRSRWVCLDRNERVSPFSPDLLADLLGGLTSWTLSGYPDYGPLYERLAALTQYPLDSLAIGAGSDGLIRRLFQAFVRAGDQVVTPEPTYAMYDVWTRIFQGRLTTQPYRNDLTLDVAAFTRLIEATTRIVVIANPDQPTGAALTLSHLRSIAERAREVGALLLIDEAYYPFFEETALPLLAEYDNLVIVRTFSKAWGIAGLRVGYAIGAPHTMKAVHAVRSPGEVASLSAIVAARLLDRPHVLMDYKSGVESGRAVLNSAAAQLGFGIPVSYGNFQVLRAPVGVSARKLAFALKERGYLIKSGFQAPCLENCVRVTLDGPAIMEPFVRILPEAVAVSGEDAHMTIG